MKTLQFFAPGLPVGQPRPRAVSFGGRARMYDPGTSNTWKACVIQAAKAAAERAGWEQATGWVVVDIIAHLPRPKGHFGSGANSGRLKRTAPGSPIGKPDVDNIAKAVLDALNQCGIWRDDAQVVKLACEKRYAIPQGRGIGAEVAVYKMEEANR